MRNLSSSRCLRACLSVLVFAVVFIIAGFHIRPLRNFVLRPVWPRVWREVKSSDVLAMIREIRIPEVTNEANCTVTSTISPTSAKNNVYLTSAVSSQTLESRLKDASHRSFLPLVDNEMKLNILKLYVVLSEALKAAGVTHFLMDGSMLGVARHDGFVPWDDDIDLSINVTDWRRVRTTLSCIDGYRVHRTAKMHWKFHTASSGYPYIDIFFYTENDDYIWAIPYYITVAMVFLKSDVFPLKTAKFESLQVPVPRHVERLADIVFGLDNCQSPSINHRTGETFPVHDVPCTSLTYLYPMRL